MNPTGVWLYDKIAKAFHEDAMDDYARASELERERARESSVTFTVGDDVREITVGDLGITPFEDTPLSYQDGLRFYAKTWVKAIERAGLKVVQDEDVEEEA
jgi:hypothetical protein